MIDFHIVGSHLSIGVIEMVEHCDGGHICESEIEVL